MIYEARAQTLKLLQSKTASAVTTASRCVQLAGRIDEAATMLLATKSSNNVPCVSSGANLAAGARADIDVAPCEKEAGQDQAMVSVEPADISIDIEAKFKQTARGATSSGSSGTTCKVLQRTGAGNPGLPNDNANFKIMGRLLETRRPRHRTAVERGGGRMASRRTNIRSRRRGRKGVYEWTDNPRNHQQQANRPSLR
ncbi:Trypanosome variant surface glycoprotein (A-type), putative [Trypanosoma equiperdum]|uniref:Trypanosome variant surface glycoprotein (A-type), putative n=2 Tax=Trypanozoon TaxID=39700 RepID=A0A1G4I2P7_TRYEQ|nr:Trypanosome variant surface glycoprotein (A-type), putative [Trypanosoma equiperdum]